MSDNGRDVESLSSILRGAGYFAMGRAISAVLGFIFNILLTRGLGPVLYGVYTLGMTINRLCGFISNLGADKAVLRFVSVDDERRSDQLGFSYLLALVGTISTGIILVLVAPWITSVSIRETRLTLVIRILSVFLVLNGLVSITGNAFRAIDRPELYSLLKQVIRPGVNVFAAGVAFFLTFSFKGYLIALVTATAATATIGIVLLFKKTSLRPKIKSRNINVSSYLEYSLPLAFKEAGGVLYTRVDLLIVGFLLTASAVGFYRIAILLSSILTLPLAAINQIFPSTAARLHEEKQYAALEQVYKTATRWVVTGSLPAAAGLIIYRAEFLQLFGSDFTAASSLLVVFTIGQLTNSIVGPSGFLLMMTDRHYLVTGNQWFFGVLNLIMNIALINLIGIIGAAVATAITMTLINLARLIEVYYLEGIHPFSVAMAKPIVAVSISIILMLAAKPFTDTTLVTLASGATVGGAGYFGILFFLGIEESDREFINNYIE